MRTDSTNLSEQAIATIADEIKHKFGEAYSQPRRFKKKNANAQEAHEAIRPSYIDRMDVSSDRDQQRLYELIWKRTIACQMADAKLEKTTATIDISTMPNTNLIAEGEVIKFDGFLKVYLESTDEEEQEDEKGVLPPLRVGQILPLNHMDATERFTRPPARYTEASLVKKLEELGIGRPSTFAPTIAKIMEEKRGYVVKLSKEGTERLYQQLSLKGNDIKKEQLSEKTGSASNHLFPTDIGTLVCDFLTEHFQDIMTYSFTAGVEEKLDNVAENGESWKKIIRDFYFPFHANVENTLALAERATGERILGKDPKSGRTVIVRITKLGKPVAQIGMQDELLEDEKPKYADLRPGQSMESLELADALELFSLPRNLGKWEGLDLTVNSGRFGPYLKYGDVNITLPKGSDPLFLNLDEAIILIQEKISSDAPIGDYDGLPVTAGTGRFGPFLKWKDLYINVPKKYEARLMTQDQIKELIDVKVNKEANRFIQNWESEKIAIENGRWGPFVRYGKKFINLPKAEDGKKMTPENAALMTLDQVKKHILSEDPKAFAKPAAKPKAVKKK